ncbi:MAG: UDP-N-acetylmuramoylalanine--D-glutamate ligase [Candidatus Paceibacteria bacterium]|jgi:UDP-N-acetylmuramoylalanine--D-glutamate ligase
MGLGLFGGGAAAARYAAKQGAAVLLTDLRDEQTLAPALRELRDVKCQLVLERHREQDFSGADVVIANPAVRPDNPYLETARKNGVCITSEVALFLDAVQAPVVAITGTQGKSSTTHLLAQLLGTEGRKVHLGGNIGRPLLGELESIQPEDICALELSSYQLECLPSQWTRDVEQSPLTAAALTNLFSDHLERHVTRARYAQAKLQLFGLLAPGGTAVLPMDPLPIEWTARSHTQVIKTNGARLRIESDSFRLDELRLGEVSQSPFHAPFQQQNLLLALGLASLAGVQASALQSALHSLRGLPHRLDRFGELDGRPLWDNLVSTTPDSTVSALEALPPGQVLLLGGRVKDLDLTPLIEATSAREATPIIFGEARAKWPAAFRDAGIEVHEVECPVKALELARGVGGTGILISPACSSFDAFPNFQARADAILQRARELGACATDSTGS